MDNFYDTYSRSARLFREQGRANHNNLGLLYTVILANLDEDGVCRKRVDDLARATVMNPRTIQRGVHALIDAGALTQVGYTEVGIRELKPRDLRRDSEELSLCENVDTSRTLLHGKGGDNTAA